MSGKNKISVNQYQYESETYDIIGAAMNVYNELGTGFLEVVYQEALEYEFALKNIPARKEVPLQIYYKGKLLSKYYVADFICYDKIIVELKSVSVLLDEHKAQVINYLKATKFQVGLLINFGKPKLEYKRVIYTGARDDGDGWAGTTDYAD
jgi:GxxExxY protein